MPRLPLLAVVIAAIALAGCSKPEDKYVGNYSGKIPINAAVEGMLAKLPPATASKARTMLQNVDIQMQLHKDMTYTTAMNLPGASNDVAGTWSLADNKITLLNKTKTVNGKPMPIPDNSADIITLGSDPTVLTMDSTGNPALAGMSIIFKKST